MGPMDLIGDDHAQKDSAGDNQGNFISMRRSSSTDSFSSISGSKICICSPTVHAGSFRCRLHRAPPGQAPPAPAPHAKPTEVNVVEAK
uniref:Uncharacterized protein n=1 Tax=Nymphaea colorata TaxID=210225 RepID=A0A5K0W445_9MAGN